MVVWLQAVDECCIGGPRGVGHAAATAEANVGLLSAPFPAHNVHVVVIVKC